MQGYGCLVYLKVMVTVSGQVGNEVGFTVYIYSTAIVVWWPCALKLLLIKYPCVIVG
jgi:hypothetical protein